MIGMEFTVLIEKSEDGYYVATVPGLPGICVTQGKTEKEALSNMRDALDLHIEGLKEQGITIKSPTPPKLQKLAISA
jgi:predicted RNase H-like HicB family nuclease